MTPGLSDTTVLVAIVVMAAVTYATRAGGLWLMARVPLNPRVHSFLRHLSGCVLVALVVPGALAGDLAAGAGVAVSVAVMALTRRALPAIVCGALAAAFLRAMSASA